MHSFVHFAVVLDSKRTAPPEQDARDPNQVRAAANGSLDSVSDTPRRCIWPRLAASVNRNFDEKFLAGADLECVSKPSDTVWSGVLLRDIRAIPLQAWTGPEGSRRLRIPDFKTIGT